MPINYLASLTAQERSARANLHLGTALAFVAGALNAGGFLAIGQYTSHMTGMLSSAADNIVLGHMPLVVTAFLSILAFALGAATTAVMVNYARRNLNGNPYMPALLTESVLLLVFGLMGANLQMHEFVDLSVTAALLCYVMGLQNALVTKISNAEIRTTHVTGLFTDIGIELGKLFYWNAGASRRPPVFANRERLRVLSLLAVSFFVGGVAGAIGFARVGYAATLPLAMVLVFLAVVPAADDLMRLRRRLRLARRRR